MTSQATHSKKGFIPVMLTPFTDAGRIDFDGLTSLTEFYLKAGASGLFANCLSSEMFELNEQERLQIINHVIKVAGSSVPIVATGTFGGAIEAQADFVKRVHDTGTQAVIAITGLLASEYESDEVFNDRVFELLELTDNVPIGFYECPVPYKRLLSPTQIGDLVGTGRIIYHKDTCLDINQIKAKLEAARGRNNFGLYDAYMAHAVESLKAGSAGLSCIQGNFFPELIVWLCENYNNPSLEHEVAQVQQFFIKNMDVMHAVYPVIAKYYLQQRGMNISTFTRRDVGNFSAQVKQDIDNLYNSYIALQSHLEIGLTV